MTQTFSNSGTFDGLDATLQMTLPNAADDDFLTSFTLSQSGVEPTINIAFAIDRSGSTANSTGIDFNGDGHPDTFLEAQVFAVGVQIQQLLDAGYDPDTINVTIVDFASSARSATFNLATESDDLLDYIDGLNSSGQTNYAAALAEVENAWDAQGVGPDETNILYFNSDGFPVPSGQDFETPLNSLEAAYNPQITAIGYGPNSAEFALDIIDSSGNASIVETEQDLIDLLNTPPPLPDIESFSVSVDGVLIETIPVGDPRVIVNPTGFTVSNLNVTGYATTPGAPQTIDVQIVANLTNGDTLAVMGPIPIVDGVVEGTAGDDLIDLAYDGDPEGDSIDAGDNIDDTATGDALDNDLVEAGDGNDTVLGLNGDDTLLGQAGDDSLVGGVGDDQLGGAQGDDTLEGGEGDDSLTGGSGDDQLDGGAGNDTLNGNSGNDLIEDAEGDNLILSGNVDTVAGTSDGLPDVGAPFVGGFVDPDPNDDRDTVTTGAGDDTIFTGDDNDVIAAGDGDNIVDGGLDDDSITAGSGDDSIVGGEGDDTILSGAGDDTIVGGIGVDAANIPDDGSDTTFPGPDPLPGNSSLSNGDDFIDAGAGDDVVLGEDDDDTILGGEGADSLDGGIDDDSILGGAGDDTILGGQGVDTMEGGGDRDLFLVGQTNGASDGDGDVIDGGSTGVDDDTLDLRPAGPHVVIFTSPDQEDGIAINAATGGILTFTEIENLLVDSVSPDGIVLGTTGADTIDILYTGDPEGDSIDAGDAILPFQAPDDDIVVADDGDDIVFSALGDDIVLGGAGNDVLDLDVGDDTGFGNTGDDYIDGREGADSLVGQEGNDTLVGGDGDDTAIGGDGADTIITGGGADVADGGAGDDLIDGFSGDDLLDGGTGNDTISAGQGDDTVDGGDGDDQLIGNPGNDSIEGGAGNDTIQGNEDNDTLSGGTGDDFISAGPGENLVSGGDDRDNILVVGDGNTFVDGGEGGVDDDTLTIFGNAEIEFDSLNPENGTVFYLDAGGVRTGITTSFINIENIETIDPSGLDGVVEGSSGADLIDGSYAGDPEGDLIDNFDALDNITDYTDIFDPNPSTFVEILGGTPRGDNRDAVLAGDGDDTVLSGDGDDVVYGGTGNDLIEGGLGADDLVGEAGDDTILGGEGVNRLFGDEGNDSLVGGEQSDIVFGGIGDDVVEGNGGNDVVFAGEGADTIIGGLGGDTIDGEGGDDSILGGLGEDVIDAGAGNNFVDAGLGQNTVTAGDGNDTIIAGAGNDMLMSGAGDDFVDAGSGDDTVDGGEGDDTLIGGAGEDEIVGGGGNDRISGGTLGVTGTAAIGQTPDTLIGGDGDDIIDGSSGDDSIDGGLGNDTLAGGSGGDTVDGGDGDDVIYLGGEVDILTGAVTLESDDPDLAAANAIENGDNIAFGGFGADTIIGSENNDSIEGGEGADSILGLGGQDTLFGQQGADTIDGGDGDDLVDGGVGGDSLLGGTGEDTLLGDVGDDRMEGGDGADFLFGGEGNDLMFADAGQDTLAGGTGSDALIHGAGADLMDGGDDRDLFFAGAGDTIIGGEGGDDFDYLIVDGLARVEYTGGDPSTESGTITYFDADLNVIGTAEFSEIEQVIAVGAGNTFALAGLASDPGIVEGTELADVIDLGYTGDPDGDSVDAGDAVPPLVGDEDIIQGFGGDDLIDGSEADDLVFGDAGNDTLLGGAGVDGLDGGDGDDSLDGGAGSDLVSAGAGNDTITGSVGEAGDAGDILGGDAGDDLFIDVGPNDQVAGGEDIDGLDQDTLDLRGIVGQIAPGGSLTITYVGGDPSSESGVVDIFDSGGAFAGQISFTEIENVIPCFTPGARIATPTGEVPVESLREGDKVITRDNGIQEIRWVGSRTLARDELARAPNLKPILIRAGALGHGLPERDMLVSPQHRVLVAGERTQLYFEESEVLVAAKHLVNGGTIRKMDTLRTTYIHFMFDRHEVVLSDGAWTESFQPGDQTLGAMGQDTRDEIVALFPELATVEGIADYAAARRALKAHEAKLLQL